VPVLMRTDRTLAVQSPGELTKKPMDTYQ
jgi:hypothetical protein